MEQSPYERSIRTGSNATVFVGAAAIVWNAATTMEDKIDTAKGQLKEHQTAIIGTQDILKERISSLESKIEVLSDRIKELSSALASLETQDTSYSKRDMLEFSQEPIPQATVQQLQQEKLEALNKEFEQYRVFSK